MAEAQLARTDPDGSYPGVDRTLNGRGLGFTAAASSHKPE